MTACDLDNLWAESPGLTNRTRSKLHEERAKAVLADAWARSSLPIVNGKVARGWVVRNIGCGPSAPSQSHRLKRVLTYWDGQVALDPDRCIRFAGGDGTGRAPKTKVNIVDAEDFQLPTSNVVPLRIDKGRIETVLCEGTSGTHEVPAIVWQDGIDVEASDWLRTLVVTDGDLPSTAHEYAKILRGFVRFRRSQGFDWDEVDDELLRRWRTAREHNGTAKDRINTSIGVVFQFYRWLEKSGRLRFHVQLYDPSEMPAAMIDHSFRLTATKSVVQKGPYSGVVNWQSTQLLKRTGRSRQPRHTPSEDETRKIHSVVFEGEHGVRNSLLFSWAEETGARGKEMLSITLDQLPSEEEVERLIEEDRPWHIRIVRKGGKEWELIVLPDLLVRTLDYVRNERQRIVDAHGTNVPHLFLSERGDVLTRDSLTSLGRKAFKKAGVRNSNVHRFRAKFLLATIEALIDAMDIDPERVLPGSDMAETILVKAVEVMGHSSVASLRPYLNYALNRRVQNSQAFKARNLEAKIRQLSHREAEVRARVARLTDLQTLFRDLAAAGHKDVAERLAAILA